MSTIKVTAEVGEEIEYPKELNKEALENAQLSLLLDEAIATFTARNRLREALTHRMTKGILNGEDPVKLEALLAQFDKFMSVDEFTKQVLDKLLK
jgi:hypothetical protein